jgi:hypothetical protein
LPCRVPKISDFLASTPVDQIQDGLDREVVRSLIIRFLHSVAFAGDIHSGFIVPYEVNGGGMFC